MQCRSPRVNKGVTRILSRVLRPYSRAGSAKIGFASREVFSWRKYRFVLKFAVKSRTSRNPPALAGGMTIDLMPRPARPLTQAVLTRHEHSLLRR